MASLFHSPAFRPENRRAVAQTIAREQTAPHASTSASISIAEPWQESLQVFSAHSGKMLLCALAGLMSPALAGYWIATQAVLQNYAWVGPVITLQKTPSQLVLIALGCATWLMWSFARGVMVSLSLQGDGNDAIHRTLLCFPALLAGALVYGALIFACMVGLSVLTQHAGNLFENEHIPQTAPMPAEALSHVKSNLLWQSAIELMWPAGAPFSSFVPEARAALTNEMRETEYEHWLATSNMAHGEVKALGNTRLPSRPDVIANLTTVGSLLLLLVIEVLLSFRTVLALEPPEVLPASGMKPGGLRLRRFAALLPLVHSARFGFSQFGVIAQHIVVLRSASFALVVLMIELPVTVATQFMMPALISISGKTPLLPLLHFVQAGCTLLAISIVLAFNVVYDARLFAALNHR